MGIPKTPTLAWDIPLRLKFRNRGTWRGPLVLEELNTGTVLLPLKSSQQNTQSTGQHR